MSNVQQEIRFTHRTKRCPLLVIKTVLHLRRYYLPRDEDRLLVVVPRSSLHSKLFSTGRQKDYRFGEKIGNILEKWRIPDEYEERLEPEEVATIVETGDQFSQMTATSQGPCTCGGGVCACCSRILLDTLKQKACVDVTYDPDEFSFTAKISMNDNVFYTRTVSCMYASFINYIIYLLNFPFIQKFTYVCNCFQGKILAQYVYQCHDFNLSKHASDFITFISKVGIFIRVWTWRGSLETPRYLRWDIV